MTSFNTFNTPFNVKTPQHVVHELAHVIGKKRGKEEGKGGNSPQARCGYISSQNKTLSAEDEELLFEYLCDQEHPFLLLALLYIQQSQEAIHGIVNDLSSSPWAMIKFIRCFIAIEALKAKTEFELFRAISPASRVFSMWMRQTSNNQFVKSLLEEPLHSLLADDLSLYDMTSTVKSPTKTVHPPLNTITHSSTGKLERKRKKVGLAGESKKDDKKKSSEKKEVKKKKNREGKKTDFNLSHSFDTRKDDTSSEKNIPLEVPESSSFDTTSIAPESRGIIKKKDPSSSSSSSSSSPHSFSSPLSASGQHDIGAGEIQRGFLRLKETKKDPNCRKRLSYAARHEITSSRDGDPQTTRRAADESSLLSHTIGYSPSSIETTTTSTASEQSQQEYSSANRFRTTSAPDEPPTISPPPQKKGSNLRIQPSPQKKRPRSPGNLSPSKGPLIEMTSSSSPPPGSAGTTPTGQRSDTESPPTPHERTFPLMVTRNVSHGDPPLKNHRRRPSPRQRSPHIRNLSPQRSASPPPIPRSASPNIFSFPQQNSSGAPPSGPALSNTNRRAFAINMRPRSPGPTGRQFIQFADELVDNELEEGVINEGGQSKIETAVRLFLNSILVSPEKMPEPLVDLLAHIREDVSHQNSAPASSFAASRFYFRYVCAVIVTPQVYGLCKEMPNDQERKVLTLISKVLQNIANGTTFGRKEQHLTPLNGFVSQATPRVQDFVEKLIELSPFQKKNPRRRRRPFSSLLTTSRSKLLCEIKAGWVSLSNEVESLFSSDRYEGLRNQMALLQGALFPTQLQLTNSPSEELLLTAFIHAAATTGLVKEERKKQNQTANKNKRLVRLTDTTLYYFLTHRPFTRRQAYVIPLAMITASKVSTTSAKIEIDETYVTPPSIFMGKQLRARPPTFEMLNVFEFFSVEECASFMNLLSLLATMTEMREERVRVSRQAEQEVTTRAELLQKIQNQEILLDTLRERKDELITKFKHLAVEQKQLRVMLERKKKEERQKAEENDVF